jgi:hypothetical protein
MARAFARIAFGPGALALQERMGSRAAYAGLASGADEGMELGMREREFIAARDTFFQATVSADGWPYVQHRGGPPGFLRVLGPQLLGYADFAGNRQYISDGNLLENDRVSLILMDYAARKRLKIWGTARLVELGTAPDLLAQLEDPAYRARIERAVLIDVAAFDWNCPKYITPRYTEAEARALFAASDGATLSQP